MTPTVKLYDAASIDHLQWPETEMTQRLKGYWLALMKDGTATYIDNVQTQCFILQVDDVVLPVTVNDAEYDNSYVCSFYAHYITYATYELSCLDMPVVEKLLATMLWAMGHILKWAKINKTVIVNNWLLSTNLYPPLSAEKIEAITQYLVQRFPEHAIAFRSINAFTTGELKASLQKHGYRMVGSRQVYLYSPKDKRLSKQQRARAQKNISRDLRLLNFNGYQQNNNLQLSDAQLTRISQLYAALYLERYCENNPQFNEKFIALAQRCRFLELIALEKDNQIDGIVGFYQIDGVMTAPLLGYDTHLPQELGLYRILSSSLIQIATARDLISHKSSGVAQFKRNRGCTAWVEYSAVYDQHLPRYRRFGWGLLKDIVYRVAIPLMKRYEL